MLSCLVIVVCLVGVSVEPITEIKSIVPVECGTEISLIVSATLVEIIPTIFSGTHITEALSDPTPRVPPPPEIGKKFSFDRT